jgi:hypothetical protein
MNLINGIEINYSSRGNTGYLGAAFCPSWTMNAEKPFIAACGKPSDPALVDLLRAPDATALHLGHYADSREAAYVTALYKADPEGILRELQNNGHNGLEVTFPAELYDLPEILTKEEALKLNIEYKTRKRSGRKLGKVTVGRIIKTDDRLVGSNRKVLGQAHGNDIYIKLSSTYGREIVKNAVDTLTVNEFELRFGL